ncbi:uncharacterized protein LOC144148092 [Haemaphysalis longicornis]
MSIKNRFKNSRKGMPKGNPEANREKEKAKMRREQGSSARPAKADCHRETAVTAFELDSVFVDEAINFMKKELKKTTPDMEKVTDAMNRTAPARRKCLESLTLGELLTAYPALTLKQQILNECFLLTGIHTDRALLAVLQEFGDIIVDAVKGKRAALPTLALAQAYINAAEGVAKSYAKEVAALALLPFLLNERGDEVFRMLDPEKLFGCPTLIYTGEDPWAPGGFSVVCEDVQVDILTFAEGMSLVFAAYWAYSIHYVASARHTLSVLEHLMDVKKTKLSVTAVKVLTMLKARA